MVRSGQDPGRGGDQGTLVRARSAASPSPGVVLRRVCLGLALAAVSACNEGEGEGAPVVKDPVDQKTAFAVNNAQSAGLVGADMFGVNFLYYRDDPKGRFGARAASVGASLLRWPGGTMSETINYSDVATYSMTDPEQTGQPGSLSRFLAYAKATGMKPTIIVPTKRYLGNVDLGVREVGEFVRRVTSGEFGDVEVPIWMIGNEFYYTDVLTGNEYGSVAAPLLKAVRDNARYPVRIAIQPGINRTNQIADVATWFNPDDVDLLDHHIFVMNDANAMSSIVRNVRSVWGQDIPFFISAWNVKTCSDPADEDVSGADCETQAEFDARDFGMRQAATMAQIFSFMVRNNTAAAAFWPLQNNTNTSMFPNERVAGTEPFVAGAVFRWLTEVSGMAQHSVTRLAGMEAEAWAYGDADQRIVFLAGHGAPAMPLTVDFGSFAPTSVTAERMHGDPVAPKQVPSIEAVVPGLSGSVATVRINVHGPEEFIILRARR